MRFRYEHPHLAASIESVVWRALDTPTPLHAIAAECAARERLTAVRGLDLSAEIVVHGREVTTRGWGCDANEVAATAAKICDCILAHTPDESHTTVEKQVSDEDLVSYEGLLLLRLWL